MPTLPVLSIVNKSATAESLYIRKELLADAEYNLQVPTVLDKNNLATLAFVDLILALATAPASMMSNL